jgi:phosphatidylglycerol:prolipoprotein diacylglycerol transferase
MYFPLDFSGQLRHPSQLYEAFLEGILLFIVLWSIRRKNFPVGYLTAFYLIGYGLARFTVEFFREPDNGWFLFSLTLGQWFSVVIIFFGIFIILKNRGRRLPSPA